MLLVSLCATAVGIFLVVVTVFSPSFEDVHRKDVLGRMERYVTGDRALAGPPRDPTGGPFVALIHALRRLLIDRDERRRDQGHESRNRLADDLARADLKFRPSEWVAILFAVGTGLGLLLTLRFTLVVGLIGGVVVPYFGARFYLVFRQRRRVIRFDRQLGDVVLLMANGLKAGHSFPQTMLSVSATAKPPIAAEFARTVRELQLGLPIEDALGRMVDRNASEDLDLVMTAVQIQRVVGGNLAEVLETIAATIRERVGIKREIRTLTAQARMSGWIISLLPLGLAGLLTVIAPDYFTPMFSQPAGIAMIGVGLGSMGIGILIIRRVVHVKV